MSAQMHNAKQILGGLVAWLLIATACAPSAASTRPAATQLYHLDFAMPWIEPAEYNYFHMADEKGFYREEGLQVVLH